MQVVIRQATIIEKRSEFHNKVVDILIEDGIIKKITPSTSNTKSSIKIDRKEVSKHDNLYVSTGWIDILADYSEPGYEAKETISTGLNAAAAGGFTQVMLAPNTNPAVSSRAVTESVLQKAKGHTVTLRPLGAVTQNIEGKHLAELHDMRDGGAVAFTDGWKPVQNANLMLKALEYVKAFDGTVIQLPIDSALAAGGLMHEGVASTRLGMAGIPAIAETLIVHRDIELARYTNSKLHITGVSCAESVEMVRKAKADGLKVSCSVTPYHLALNDEALNSYSSLYKVMPPLRTEEDRLALVAGLKDGTIDCIASHHRPQDWDAKEKEFEYACEGMNIQEIAFSVALTAMGKKASIDKLVAAFTTNAAKIFGMETVSIQKGNAASLTIFSTEGEYEVSDKMQSKSKNNPFIGKTLTGKVIGVINNNQVHLNK